MRPRVLPLVLAALVTLGGAGCSLERKIGVDFSFPSGTALTAADASLGIPAQPGLRFTVRPSVLGVTGSVDQLLGLEERTLHVTLGEAAAARRSLVWEGASASGTLDVSASDDVQSMLLPAFWTAGMQTASNSSGLWLSRSAYDALSASGTAEWKIGLADRTLTVAASALKSFNDLAFRFFRSATAVPEISPFTLKETGTSETFPLTVDGRLLLLRTITASNWLADFVVLDNPENPLILKVAVHPAAEPALRAFASSPVRWEELGYEITEMTRP